MEKEVPVIGTKKKKTIMVSIPHMWHCRIELVEWVAQLFLQQEYIIQWYRLPLPKIPHDHARNAIVHEFRTNPAYKDADKLMMVDADVLPPVEILQLADWDHDLVFGMCLVFNGEDVVSTASKFEEIDGKTVPRGLVMPEDQTINPIPVDAAGGGVTVMSRNLVDTMHKKGGECWPLYAFDYDENGLMWQGEDYHFCIAAKKAGFQSYLDRRFLCDHNKEVSLKAISTMMYNMIEQAKDSNKKSNGNSDSSSGSRKSKKASG